MKIRSPREALYAEPCERVLGFVFAEVFAALIRRSVSGYDPVISLVALLAQDYTRRTASAMTSAAQQPQGWCVNP